MIEQKLYALQKQNEAYSLVLGDYSLRCWQIDPGYAFKTRTANGNVQS